MNRSTTDAQRARSSVPVPTFTSGRKLLRIGGPVVAAAVVVGMEIEHEEGTVGRARPSNSCSNLRVEVVVDVASDRATTSSDGGRRQTLRPHASSGRR